MILLDYIIFILGIYGIAWFLVHGTMLQKPISFIMNKSKFLKKLFSCIVCVSFWVSIPFCQLYFSGELWFTKTLICFSQVTLTWLLASLLGDLNG